MSEFKFNISLQILNHLGRNLYRNFITVLGEAISNSWDADASNVWIEIDQDTNTMVIYDDGVGMTEEDFQGKFLKIGYSKRNDGSTKTARKRPFIGRKGIGKLALLSCAKNITILSRAEGQGIIGGVISNEELDQAIQDDLSTQEYSLGTPKDKIWESSREKIKEHGTFILCENLNDGIRNRTEYIRKLIALHFKFSLIDSSFSIYVNGKQVTEKDLSELADNTEFIWRSEGFEDPFLDSCKSIKESPLSFHRPDDTERYRFSGFIASVEKPSHLKIRGLPQEKLGVDLFVNGRLREKDFIHNHNLSSAQHVANYLYGQIHIDALDDGRDVDRFTSSREGVIGNDPLVKEYLKCLTPIIKEIERKWSELRRKHREDDDPEDDSITQQRRKSEQLINLLTKSYDTIADRKVKEWLDTIRREAYFNIESYGDCFIVENLLRQFFLDQGMQLPEDPDDTKNLKMRAEDRKKAEHGQLKGIKYSDPDIRAISGLIYYLDLGDIGRVTLGTTGKKLTLLRLLRNAVAHTCQLTERAKIELTEEVSNIKGQIISKLNGES